MTNLIYDGGNWNSEVSPTATVTTEVLNVKTYGAVGDNSTDDTAAFQKALDDAAAAHGGTGTVYVPSGGIYLVGPLIMRSNVSFTGCGWGSRLRLRSGVNDYLLTLVNSNRAQTVTGSRVSSMSIDCNGGSQTAGGGINLCYTTRCVLDHVAVQNGWHAAVMNTASSEGNWPFENTITNCLFSLGKNSANVAKAGFALDLQDAEECFIHSNAFEFNGVAHIKEGVVGNNSIHHNTFVNGKVGIWSNGSRGRWDHNIFDSLSSHNIRVIGNCNTIDGNAFFQPGQDGVAGSASCVALDWGATGNSVTGNKFYAHSAPGRTRSFIFEMFNNTRLNLVAHNHYNLNKSSLSKGVTEVQGTGNTYVTNIRIE